MACSGRNSDFLCRALVAVAVAILLAVPGEALALSCDPPNTRSGTEYGLGCGPEFKVNEIPFGNQWLPAIAPAPDGGFAAAWAWAFPSSQGWSYGVFARRFDALGAPLSGDIAVNATKAGEKKWPVIAADPSGGFTVAWASYEQDGSSWGVYARRFDSTGAPLTGEIQVNATTASHQWLPAIASDAGGFTVAWTSNGQDGSGYGVYARRFNAAGVAVSSEMAMNSTTAGDQWEPVIASDPGAFTIAWTGPDASGDGVYARRFDFAGHALTGEVQVNTTNTSDQWGPSITRTSDGFAIAWTSDGQDNTPGLDPGYGVYARRFDSAGIPLSGEIAVATGGGDQWSPAIAAVPGGRFAVAYVAEDDLGSEGIRASRFDAAGERLPGVAVNVFSWGGQVDPTIAADGSGGFTIAWMSWGEDWEYGDWGVFARRFADGPDTWIELWPWTPEGVTNDPTLSFTFQSHEQDATFECQLDGGGFSPCESPHTTAALGDGTHKFEVRAVADGKTDPWPDSRTVKVDTTPPDTFIDSGPSGLTNDRSPTFTYHSSEPNAYGNNFECRVDSGTFTPCWTWSIGALSDGSHTFEVRSTDAAGNTDPTPASRSFTVDATPPRISIDSGPVGSTSDTTPTFAFSSNELGSTFECQVDFSELEETISPCVSPVTTGLLPDGMHSFEVRTSDAAKNIGVAVRIFTVDTVAPDTSITSGPSSLTNNATPTFGLSSNEGGAQFECKLDSGDFEACASPFTTVPLADGPHSLEFRAVDAAANKDPSPAVRSITIDTVAPDTAIDSGPFGPTRNTAPTFGFSAGGEGARFECELDRDAYTACSSPSSTRALTDGSHSFRVRATDEAGNTDLTPAVRRFRVDTRPPVPTLHAGERQVAGRAIEVEVSCEEDCTVIASGRIVAWRDVKRPRGAAHAARRMTRDFELREVTQKLKARETGTLVLRPQRKATLEIRRLIRQGWRARAVIDVDCSDRAGNSGTAKLTLKLNGQRA